MNQHKELISKVLVLDGSEAAFGVLKIFCKENHLVGLRASTQSVHDVMSSNIDFGAILISEESISDGVDSLALSYEIHCKRPDLPIFLRRYDSSSLSDFPELPKKYQHTFAGAYCLSNLEALKNLVHDQIFDEFYPTELVQGIRNVSEGCIKNGFKNVNIESDLPFLVRDKLMDDFNSLIALESKWCRGYMMLQVNKSGFLAFIKANKTGISSSDILEQDANALLSDLTNEIWGVIQREFMGYGNALGADANRTQVPLFIDPDKRYISFGTSKPQLCYRYKIYDESGELAPLVITHKLIFNLDWSPENFELSEKIVDEFIDSGELEMF